MSTKKNTASKATSTNTKPESSLDGLNIQAPKVFKGIFRAWARNVSDPADPTRTVKRAKCVCQVPTKDPDVKVDLTAWISEDTAAAAGITIGDKGKAPVPFVGTFAYTGVRLEAERGQYGPYNEERSLTQATLVAVE